MIDKKEIERKWIVNKNNIPDILIPYEYNNIVQFYTENGVRYRLCEGIDLNTKYYKTEKFGEGLVRVEKESEITSTEYNEMVEKLSPFIPITKIRYKIKFGKDVIELDEFDTGECYAEIEFNSEQEALEFTDPPAWFGKEVTGDNTHSNFSIYTKMQQKV